MVNPKDTQSSGRGQVILSQMKSRKAQSSVKVQASSAFGVCKCNFIL